MPGPNTPSANRADLLRDQLVAVADRVVKMRESLHTQPLEARQAQLMNIKIAADRAAVQMRAFSDQIAQIIEPDTTHE